MIKALKGMRDILPEEIAVWQELENAARSLFELFSYREIRTPALEEASLFVRSIGQSTDIVQKEMYAFKDKGERPIALRPEGTAPVVRSYIENGLDKVESLSKLYYIGPMFRSEKPQSGRQRQFHQIGVEAIGSESPFLDAEIIYMMKAYFDKIGLSGFSIKLNTLGCAKDKTRIKKELAKYLSKETNLLCKDCKARRKNNILRVFDCKVESCRAVLRAAPKMTEYICEECSGHFESVKKILDSLDVPYTADPYIVRGLDYYTSTTFEVTHPNLGAQDAIGAGGRYDNLVRDTGGPKAAAFGFALGEDRLVMALGSEKKPQAPLDIYFAAIGERAHKEAFLLCNTLRKNGVSSDIDYQSKSLKAQMRQANRRGARYVVILGEDELEKKLAILRNMSDSQQSEIKMDLFVEEIKKTLKC
ncbi:MAG: histidine--tRNA ligase [Candidatus Omnitrophota bacterium]